jgi:hypothetical protein
MIIHGKEIKVDCDNICKNCGKRAGDHIHLGGNCPTDKPNVSYYDSHYEQKI